MGRDLYYWNSIGRVLMTIYTYCQRRYVMCYSQKIVLVTDFAIESNGSNTFYISITCKSPYLVSFLIMNRQMMTTRNFLCAYF